MASLVAATRQLSRLSSPKLPTVTHSSFAHRRGFASAAEHHGPQKVNVWQDPMSPSRWKEEQFVIVSLAGWGTLFFGAYKFFTTDKKEKVADSPK